MRKHVMPPDYTKPPYSSYAPPGTIGLTAAALELAREFAEQVARAKPDQVVALD